MKKFITGSYYTSLLESIMYEYMKEKGVSKITISNSKEYNGDVITFYEGDSHLVVLSTSNVFNMENLLSK